MNKKIIIIIVAAVLLIAGAVCAGILFRDEISNLFSDNGSSAAADDVRIMDVEQEATVLRRLGEIRNGIDERTISRDAALEELSSMADLGIAVLENDIADVIAYVQSAAPEADAKPAGPDDATTAQEEPSSVDAADSELTDNEDNERTTAEPERTTEREPQTEPLPSVSTDPQIVSASTIVGTVLPQSNVDAARSFDADKAIDGYYDSCWCVSTGYRGGAGAVIRFELKETSLVSGVMLINGNLYLPDEGIYMSNGQVQKFTLTFSDGSSQTFTASQNDTASSAYQYFELDTPVTTDSIILTVDSGYAGVKYPENVCLGEFDVY